MYKRVIVNLLVFKNTSAYQCDFDFKEIPGLSDTDEGSSDDEGYEGLDAKKKSRVKFSKHPIKVKITS